jgi:glutathione S-transferase
MIIVHHLNNSRSQRILWLLEELGLPYDIKRYERNAKTMLAPPELKAVHPLGKSPVITDDMSGSVVTVAESGAIVEYLVDTYGDGRFKPAQGSADQLRYTYWLHYAEGSLMPPLLMKLVFDEVERAPVPFFLKPVLKAISSKVKTSYITPQIELNLDYLDAELGKSPWFAGKAFTAADVQMSFPLEAAASKGGLNDSRPKLTAFLAKIHARPAYKRALKKGGTYEI